MPERPVEPCACCGEPIARGERVTFDMRCQLGRNRGRTVSVAKSFHFHRRCYYEDVDPIFEAVLFEKRQPNRTEQTGLPGVITVVRPTDQAERTRSGHQRAR